jgi:predicted nucleic acid-binding protein
MRGFLDANVVLRYLTGEPIALALRARQIIDTEVELVLTDGTVAEVAYVLMQRYGVARAVAVDSLIAFVRKRNVSIWRIDKDTILQALHLCRPSGRVSVADAMLWAAVRSTADTVVYSFDQHFPSDGISVRQDL